MENLLLKKVEYKIETTNFGVWRCYLHPTAAWYMKIQDIPYIH